MESSSSVAAVSMEMRIKTVFFDAVGTLIHLRNGVGHSYCTIAARHGILLDETEVNQAFRSVWKETALRPVTGKPRPEDDKTWWRDLVWRIWNRCGKNPSEIRFDAWFDELYLHFTDPGVWQIYPEVVPVLSILGENYRLGIISNFDKRLRTVLDQFGVLTPFEKVILSSEVGADKPHPYIFQHALRLFGVEPANAFHIGDDPVDDWQAAQKVGMNVFRLNRPANSLLDAVDWLNHFRPE